ncbi:MAG TPA: F0F1 ATP synthase subunit A [Bdellovibrionota bacterium]|nr:F0F1 ATP synthase subunit A [Bdellovibrionota bacterium]
MEHPFTFFQAYFPGVDHRNLHVVTAGFGMVLLAGGTIFLYPGLRDAKRNVVPDGRFSLKSIFEVFLNMWTALCEEIIGHGGRKYLPFVGSIFFFLFVCNLIGLIPGFLPPTENWVTGAALATISFLAFNYFGFREHGIAYFTHFVAPISLGRSKSPIKWVGIVLSVLLLNALYVPIELLAIVIRPVTLSVRLYANIFADHLVVGIFSGLVPYVVPIPFMLLGVFVSFMQAFIFTLLTTVYISGAVAHKH